MHSSPRQYEQHDTGGFTLLELIAVMIVLAVMTCAVVPLFRGSLAALRTDRAAQDFISLLKHTQERAITDSTEYRFYMDEEDGVYWAVRLAAIDEEGEKIFEPVSTKKSLPEGLEMDIVKAQRDSELGARYITFFPSGACDIAKIQIKQPKEDAIVIETKGKLGQFKV